MDSYAYLPYEYVILAYHRMTKARTQELHYAERPVSMIASMIANHGRDPKRKKTPFAMDDFYLYQPMADRNLPAGRFGAAAMELIRQNKYPSWALFCYKDLAANSSAPAPSLLSYEGEDFLLLAPVKKDGYLKGLLIAQETASDKIRKATSPTGEEVFLQLPHVPTKFIAEEDCELKIV